MLQYYFCTFVIEIIKIWTNSNYSVKCCQKISNETAEGDHGCLAMTALSVPFVFIFTLDSNCICFVFIVHLWNALYCVNCNQFASSLCIIVFYLCCICILRILYYRLARIMKLQFEFKLTVSFISSSHCWKVKYQRI